MGSDLRRGKDVFWNGRASFRKEVALTAIGIGVTLLATLLTGVEIATLFLEGYVRADTVLMAEEVAFAVVVAGLVFGNLDYQASRLAYFRRLLHHAPSSPEELDESFDGSAPSLALLVPSYKEELQVVEQTLLSCALQRYPQRFVVLLIDDPPRPENRKQLERARSLVGELHEELRKQAEIHARAREDYLERRRRGGEPGSEYRVLGRLYTAVADWFAARAAAYPARSHTDALFVELVLREQAAHYAARARHFLEKDAKRANADVREIDREYRRLASVFHVEITSFERKRHVNLSHEPNKAMNLNSYLSLMGRCFRPAQREDGEVELAECPREEATLKVPAPKYVITLDADSLLHPEYALRLTRIMEQKGNERLAVIQTPYSAVPGPSLVLERIAGATTDVQYVIDQGASFHDAAFWVGANALLRREALEDIREHDVERGHPIVRFIQDRTVIEDTESSVDLIAQGWRLHNYPERLSFSATPQDFGSLLIQRRRWANGGLIILPKLLRHLSRVGGAGRRFGEAFSRIHYLASIPVVTAAVFALLFYPFERNLRSIWFPLTAVSYFTLYGRDLVQAGYRASDLFRVYVLNLMLLPIHLGGVLKSLHQAWTREKIPFHRTPKVAGRVSAPAGYVLAEYGILVGLVGLGVWDLLEARWLHAGFGLFSAGCFAYACVVFLGPRESLEDLLGPLRLMRSLRRLGAQAPPVARGSSDRTPPETTRFPATS